ncbi:MAG TPA: 3',5'-cyclic-nucleotide phosphodiesterase [Zoogloea sp.]|uniref:3',5'-cyclic-nucleotide phosphodiesterase n=1 Tax=Zoogloea sp. TaxID=49181 RepID=UPI002B96B4CA|nr:3',5'-cyclic-nucleotide phosphodiesterase [Zoogloea sp.]HMV18589.1 3',5'-cyclic-nucleotide phosphodiesterase [Rhodocyclaceae bacterium]HMV64539.1 3',5'-cyclic-nucleotide phosphodiesterase [Rhodocyclaceae bacterium]HMW53247.1 3',5'-cyclic-nucleotide phosphodiesterase [Rhodocyclaceae bacterium]HMY49930.1 3',5'-cyclic-nucleotide phosphodiesterase [Rhodocyclaceae bacterium]HMZ76531.1 3',5'-cyclic-nucleotide phosphodiesterase [Rhodocyclaceae bacterium]
MKVQVLGCSGGIGGRSQRTTSLLVDQDVLIDAGTGVGDLEFDELLKIDHVFVTHAHLDHIAMIPLLVDTVGEARSTPIVVHGSPETLRILRSHIFNWLIWPDFSSIPDRGNPFLRFHEIHVGETVALDGGREITALPALHTVPAVAYRLACAHGSLVFSGDTTYSEPLIAAINEIPDLRYLIVETAFPDALQGLALASRHLCPSLLALFLGRLTVNPEVWITHLKPSRAQTTLDEIVSYCGRFEPRALYNGLEFAL